MHFVVVKKKNKLYLNKLMNGFNVVKHIIITVLRKRKCVGEEIIEGSELMKTQPCHATPFKCE
jgi:hypothetical protein